MLGAGFMARTHSHAALASRAELALIAASTPESSARAAIELGYERGVSVDELLAAELPVVHVCTPNETHVEYARAALRGGSHVICEKPLAISGSAANGLAAEAAELDRIGAVPFVYRYHPMVREARERIRAGAAGSIVTISGQYLQDWLLEAQDDNWRVDPDAGGPSRAFADIGSHLVDLVEFVSGDRITRLVSAVRTLHPERAGKSVATEDTVALTAELAGGGVASMLVSQVAPGRKNGLVLEIGGSKESVRFEQEDPERLWVGRREQSLLLQK
ncbi:MAG TPA: Gfo/Idh/MocA family oxidoreductase, partial [Candidatus Agrococcus pullicola]|nr:Gfo/Idh/MocA family oxidoreductase [Candidatus Agrococcus pullicola]